MRIGDKKTIATVLLVLLWGGLAFINPIEAQVDCQALMNEILSMGPGYGSYERAQQLGNIYNQYCLGGQRQNAPQVQGNYCANGGFCNAGTTCCGQLCCGSGKICAQGQYCIPEVSDHCGGGRWCSSGTTCMWASETIGSVSRGQLMCVTEDERSLIEQRIAEIREERAERLREAREAKRRAEEERREAARLKQEQLKLDAQRRKEEQQRQIAEKKRQEEEARQAAQRKKDEEAARKLAEADAKRWGAAEVARQEQARQAEIARRKIENQLQQDAQKSRQAELEKTTIQKQTQLAKQGSGYQDSCTLRQIDAIARGVNPNTIGCGNEPVQQIQDPYTIYWRNRDACFNRQLDAIIRGANPDTVICDTSRPQQQQTTSPKLSVALTPQQLAALNQNTFRLQPEERKIEATTPKTPSTDLYGVPSCTGFGGRCFTADEEKRLLELVPPEQKSAIEEGRRKRAEQFAAEREAERAAAEKAADDAHQKQLDEAAKKRRSEAAERAKSITGPALDDSDCKRPRGGLWMFELAKCTPPQRACKVCTIYQSCEFVGNYPQIRLDCKTIPDPTGSKPVCVETCRD